MKDSFLRHSEIGNRKLDRDGKEANHFGGPVSGLSLLLGNASSFFVKQMPLIHEIGG